SGLTKSNGPPFAVSFSASAAPVSGRSPTASQRRGISAQVIAFPPPSITTSPLALSPTFRALGTRGGGGPPRLPPQAYRSAAAGRSAGFRRSCPARHKRGRYG